MPNTIGCDALAKAGLWSCVKCCRGGCHDAAGDCGDDLALAMDLGPPGAEGSARVEFCCEAASVLNLTALDFDRLLTARTSPSRSAQS